MHWRNCWLGFLPVRRAAESRNNSRSNQVVESRGLAAGTKRVDVGHGPNVPRLPGRHRDPEVSCSNPPTSVMLAASCCRIRPLAPRGQHLPSWISLGCLISRATWGRGIVTDAVMETQRESVWDLLNREETGQRRVPYRAKVAGMAFGLDSRPPLAPVRLRPVACSVPPILDRYLSCVRDLSRACPDVQTIPLQAWWGYSQVRMASISLCACPR
ncbi:hypothetical protein QBC41DRAFT_10457 [Cercophora samala]|uniref:Uncharacterized protein n=1 Tax=Cercophora samala TaxID=330535 RepID=A0AA39Z7P4_9PEZI|nr:hypothetical protein QBC41DRAFT_10457 [Cercophora samala]